MECPLGSPFLSRDNFKQESLAAAACKTKPGRHLACRQAVVGGELHLRLLQLCLQLIVLLGSLHKCMVLELRKAWRAVREGQH